MLKGSPLRVAQAVLVVFPSFFLFGYVQIVVGGLVNFDHWVQTFPEIDTTYTTGADRSHRSVIEGVYVASFTLGAAVGALSCLFTGDVLGRRRNVFLGGLVALIGTAISCSAFQLSQLIVGRVVTGMGVGILNSIVPIWQSECSPATNRGKHVVIDGIFITCGYAVADWVAYGFSRIDQHPVSWRVPLAIPSAACIILCLSVFLFPESPRWLVRIGKAKQAAQGLARIKNIEAGSEDIQKEIAAIQSSLEETAQNTASFKDIFTMKDGKLFYRLMLCIGIQFWIQMTGANVISTYSTTIFQDNLDLSASVSRILAACAMTWKCLASFVAFFTIDRFGRRKLFLFSGTGVTLCMMAMAISSRFAGPENRGASIASAFFLFLFNFFFPIGFLGPTFLYCTEIAPLRLRVTMTSLGIANNWLWNFMVQMVTPVALTNIGWKYYLVYMFVTATFPVTVYFFYPETMGQSLEQLEDLFQRDWPIWKIVRAASQSSKGSLEEGLDEGSEAKTKIVNDEKEVVA
ncbi:general substrate transporter [Aspergillus avenaceus]|uniref:General substrate transporter n=1 Tax=Aspergillus avenaceus TaxID=36643 RepID=A0A5N6TTU8_ASPAV|nr:general substrate transporter [Aspergillus avenaceus]